MKKVFRKISPNPIKIRKNKILSKLNLNNHRLWNFNHRTISRAVAVGLFCAFLPIPFQMILAAALAIIFSANILISISLIWITNPLTLSPIFYSAYKLGALILDVEHIGEIKFSIANIDNIITIIWQPLLLGSIIFSSISAIIGYYTIYLIYNIQHGDKMKKKRKIKT